MATGASLVLMTLMLSVACTGAAMPSLTLTVKLFTPTSLLVGTPESAPLEATISHAGPLSLEKVNEAPASTSAALPARLPV